MYGAAFYTISSFLATISPSANFLILFSFFQGIGCSMIFATGVAILSSAFPGGRRGEALGIYITAVYLGLFIGPVLGGFFFKILDGELFFLQTSPLDCL